MTCDGIRTTTASISIPKGDIRPSTTVRYSIQHLSTMLLYVSYLWLVLVCFREGWKGGAEQCSVCVLGGAWPLMIGAGRNSIKTCGVGRSSAVNAEIAGQSARTTLVIAHTSQLQMLDIDVATQ